MQAGSRGDEPHGIAADDDDLAQPLEAWLPQYHM